MATRFKGVPNLPFAPIVAAMFGLGAAAFVFAIPVYYVERAAEVSGLASVLPAARAPLGNTAQGLIALVAALGTFAFLWIALRPVEKLFKRRKAERKARSFGFGRKQSAIDPDDMPLTAAETLPTRKPIFAEAELGAPLMSDAALASGGELLVDAQTAASPSLLDDDRPLDLTAMLEEPALVLEQVVKPEPVSEAHPAPIEWLTPDQLLAREEAPVGEPLVQAELEPVEPIVEAAPVAETRPAEEPTLSELLVRFEAALKKRRELEARSPSTEAPFPDSALTSLRDLMAVNRVR